MDTQILQVLQTSLECQKAILFMISLNCGILFVGLFARRWFF